MIPGEPAVLRATAGAAGRPFWASRSLYWTLFWLNAAIVVAFWWASTGSQPMRSTGDALNAAGRLTGLLGTYLALWQLLLMTRQPWLDAAFGLDRLAIIHRWNGYLALGLLAAHAVLQTLGYQLVDGLDTLAQLGDFFTAYDGVLPATAGLVLLVAIVAISITIVRRRLAYETWYFVHLYTYLAIALAFGHELAVGADFIANRAFAVYWWLLYIAVATCLVVFRLALPLLRYQRHRFHVAHVRREAPGVVSIYIGGRDLWSLPTQAGQFMLWRFLDRERWWQAHPFSLSLAPGSRHLRLTVKRIGDFSGRVATLRPGTPVLVEGPFGSFTERSCLLPRALLVAGGVGITPLRPLAERLAVRGVDVCLLYRCTREQDVVFRQELDQLAEAPNVRVRYVIGERRRGGDPLRWTELRRLAPDVADREVFVCGPPGMTRTVMAGLDRLGVPAAQRHWEAFRL
ncbi:MAG TPA: ferric reductase-like transmembrane domain-containing protein [Candidatus Dormibacteraeota bacterium]|nr:ferric reductase-like transmembrane domain-containing protein [Candidatus Dormibacteraeota bacterium]